MLYLFGAKIRFFLVTSKAFGKNIGRVIKKKIGDSPIPRVAYWIYRFIMMK